MKDNSQPLPLMTHVVAGYPDLKTSQAVLETMIEADVAWIEIQFPFSDPIADGPTLLHANTVSLENGTTMADCFDLVQKLQSKISAENRPTKLIIMTYFNVVHAYGVDDFVAAAKAARVSGCIIPDYPIESEPFEGLISALHSNQIQFIPVISPVTTKARMIELSNTIFDQMGFQFKPIVYCMSRTGITGTETKFSAEISEYISTVRAVFSSAQIALGFGIQSVPQILEALEIADLAVIGSHLTRISEAEGVAGVQNFLTTVSNR